jgi:hypothetical protein
MLLDDGVLFGYRTFDSGINRFALCESGAQG